VEQAAAELGLGAAVVGDALHELAAAHRVVTGGFRPGATGDEWCDTDVLRRVRRLSAARLQEQIEPVEQVALGRFLPQWSDLAPYGERPGLRGPDGVYAAIERLAGLPLPLSAWEQWILPARVADYQPHWLDELMAGGDIVWWGSAALPGRDGWVAMAPADLVENLRPAAGLPEAPDDALSQHVLALLGSGGGWFFPALLAELAQQQPSLTATALLDCLWGLVWSGRVGNDAFLAARAHLGRTGGGRTGTRRRRPGAAATPATGVGRWSILPSADDPTRSAAAQIERAVGRHGLIVRGSLSAEPIPGGFSAAYKVLSSMAERGRLTRLYLVDGLGGAQFAAPGAVDRVRDASAHRSEGTAYVLAATDPANPYGAALAWPGSGDSGHRPGRKAGALVVLVDGTLAAYLERGGRSLITFAGCAPQDLRSGLAALSRALRLAGGRTAIQRVNGESAAAMHPGDPVADALTSAGFVLTPSGLRPGRATS
jgi:ATP-dependent Lhr-like helicase